MKFNYTFAFSRAGKGTQINYYKMRKLLLLLLLLAGNNIFCQKSKINVLSQEKELGTNLLNNTPITGTEYIFPERIHDFYVDTVSGFLTVQLRGLSSNGKYLNNTGNIVQFDPVQKNVAWTKKIAYQSAALQQFSNTMIYSVANKSTCLDIRTGQDMWEVNNSLYFVDPEFNLGLGYRYKMASGYSNDLEGIDLKNGRICWKRVINREYTWNDIFYTSDTTVLIVAAGLHSLNLKNGKGWDYDTETGKKDYKETVGANAAGIAVGLLTGTFVTTSGYNLVRDVVSNVLADSTCFYFSSKEQLAKINRLTGEVEWAHPFEKNMSGKSSIYYTDSLLILINKGYALMGNRQINFGKPFIAAYDRSTGAEKYLSFTTVKDDPIRGFWHSDGQIFLLFKNRVAVYSEKDGRLLMERDFKPESYDDLKFFVRNQFYLSNGNTYYYSLPQYDSTMLYVYCNNGKILALDQQLNVTRTLSEDELFFCYLYAGDYNFIAKDKTTMVLDSKGIKVAEIQASVNAFLIGNTLYDKQNNSFLTIDLTELIAGKRNVTN